MTKRFKLIEIKTKEMISILKEQQSIPKTCTSLGVSRWAFYKEIKKRGYKVVPTLVKGINDNNA